MLHITTQLFTLLTTLTLGVEASTAEDGAKQEKVHEVFTRLDTDASGSLSLDEFVAGHKEEKAEIAAKRFAKMDRDGDGSISADEFKAGYKARNKQK
jgi:Ca2+-binding EF-hand superfamily protein